MTVPDWIEKLGRKVFESPFSGEGSNDAVELSEIRLAMLDGVRSRCQRVSGRQVFPYNAVSVLVRGVQTLDATGVWQSPFVREMFERELRAGLTKARVHFPEDLTVEVSSTPVFPVPPEEWIAVEVQDRPRPDAASLPGQAALVVAQGTANIAELPIDKARINIGRTVDVRQSHGPLRRNDLAFTDDSAINRTVSREHAHILFSKARGEYRLFNDRVYSDGNCGLWVLRDGLSQSVHHDDRGVRLLNGDEIHFGSAVVHFILK